MTSPTDRITEVLTGFRVDPSPAVCGCYELTPEDARAVAEQVAAELQLKEIWGVVSPDDNDVQDFGPDEDTARDEVMYLVEEGLDTAKLVRRWVSAWSAVEEKP